MTPSITELQARAARLESELRETRSLLERAAHDADTVTADLVATRAYAFSARSLPTDDVVSGCADALDRFGFCVIDDVIPGADVAAIREEVERAEVSIAGNMQAIRAVLDAAGEQSDASALLETAADAGDLELRPVRRRGYGPKPPNDIVWMPAYARHLAHPVVTAVARRVLDDHLKIAQLHLRPIAADHPDGTPGGFGSVRHRGRADTREWHTDWPHDLSAYGSDDPRQNAGCIRQPFPDVAMCLVMIWYLTDVDPDSAGTWVVPGSHKDARNPRGPADGMTVTAPIPGDMQISARAGSVYIQDSRTWHASAMHNPAGRKRVAVVNRWCPWWMSVDDYAPGGTFNTVCRPLSHGEYQALPADLQPLMRHLCPDELDAMQQPVLDRAKAAAMRTRWGYRQLEENPEGLADANAHIRVPLDRPSKPPV